MQSRGRSRRARLSRLQLAMVLLAVATGVVAVQVAYADTMTVTTPDDVVDANGGTCLNLAPGHLPGPDGLVSLREALCAANTNPNPDTIVLPAGTYLITQTGSGEDANALGDLDILEAGGDLTISGAGASTTIIDGNGAVIGDRVLDIPFDTTQYITLTITGVTIQHGKLPDAAGGLGGGLYVQRAHNVRIENSTIYSNTAWQGGGIWTRSAALDVAGSTLSDNRAFEAGGGIYHDGGGGTVTIEDSTLSGNRAEGRADTFGGGLYNYDGAVSIARSTLSGNRVTGGIINGAGGGLYSRAGTVDIENSTVSGNRVACVDSYSFGAGLCNRASTMTINDSVISNNEATTTGSGGCYGGGLSNGNGLVTITRSAVSGNFVGGDASNGGGIDNDDGTVAITNTTISGNRSDDSGGGIYNTQGAVRLSFVTVTRNVADDDGNGYGEGGGLTRNIQPIHLKNTIVAANIDRSPAEKHPDCYGDLTSYGYNLIGDQRGIGVQTGCAGTAWQGSDQVGGGGNPVLDPLLYPLADNGGQTQTHALRPGSPAVDAAICTDIGGNTITSDQRFWARPWGPTCDIGAYEARPDLTNIKTATPATNVPRHDEVTYTIVLTNSGAGHADPVSVADILPPNVTFARWLPGGQPAGAIAAPDSIAWSGAVSGGQVISFAFVVTHTGDYGDVVTNTAEYNYSFGSGGADATFKVAGPPVLGIDKAVTPGTGVAYHDPVAYTIRLSNSGQSKAVGVAVTDTLPAKVAFTRWLPGGRPAGARVDNNGQITWLGDVTGGTEVTFAFVATHTGDRGDVVINAAEYGHETGRGSDSATFSVGSAFNVYLPIVLKDAKP